MIEIIESTEDETIEIHIEEDPEITSEDITYECTVCESQFGSIEAHLLRYHKDEEVLFRASAKGKNHAKNSMKICDFCNTEFQNSKSLALHMKMHLLTKNRNISDLPEYRDCLSEDDLWRCNVCEKYFLEELRHIHEQTHTSIESSLICPVCNKEFENISLLEMHKAAHTNTNLERSNDMSERYGTNDGVGKFECQYCSKCFKKPYQKVRHEMIHTGEKSYVCDVCQKSFRTRNCLTLHLRTHSDAKPYICKTCSKSFKSVSAYNHHLLTHSDETRYSCEVCKKAFKTLVMLGNHRKIHTKPYNCEFCDRRFSSLFTAKKHMSVHESGGGEKKLQFACEICSARFGKKSALENHFSQDHAKGVIVEDGIEYILVAKK